MAPLRNIRHEKFAQAIIDAPSNKDAYLAAYPEQSMECASTSAGRLLNSVEVKQRILELLQQNEGTKPENITRRLGQLVNSENEGIAIQSVNTALKAFKVFEEDKLDVGIGSINIVFGDAVQNSLNIKPSSEGA